MAKAEKKNDAVPVKKSGGKMGMVGSLIGLALIIAFLPATGTLLLVGLLPTFAMMTVDRSPQHYGTLAVLVPSLAGTLPFVPAIWHTHGGASGALTVIMQPMTLLVMFGAAGAGSVIYQLVPRMVGLFGSFRAQNAIAERRAYQKMLEKKWGPAVKVRDED